YIALKAIAGEGEREEQSFELAKQEQEQEKTRRLHETVAADFLETGTYQAGEASQNTIAIDELIAEHPRLVIVGEPGSGKSTVLDYILLRLIRDPKHFVCAFNFKQAPLPVFLPLRFLNLEALPAPEDFSTLCVPEILKKQCPADFFRKNINAGHCVFLLDGLDEITVPKERRAVRNWIQDLSAAFPDNRYLVTSRIVGYRDAPLHNNFQKYRLCDFDWQDIRIFAARWQDAIHRQRRGETESDRKLRIQSNIKPPLSALSAFRRGRCWCVSAPRRSPENSPRYWKRIAMIFCGCGTRWKYSPACTPARRSSVRCWIY
ncbi:MAG: NACHT domain-containing protein, partial [Gammaproteobacteria bacterium]|nr:NACHT domain-containing protein [Gammaproteobacteria bacterium]